MFQHQLVPPSAEACWVLVCERGPLRLWPMNPIGTGPRWDQNLCTISASKLFDKRAGVFLMCFWCLFVLELHFDVGHCASGHFVRFVSLPTEGWFFYVLHCVHNMSREKSLNGVFPRSKHLPIPWNFLSSSSSKNLSRGCHVQIGACFKGLHMQAYFTAISPWLSMLCQAEYCRNTSDSSYMYRE